MKNINGYLISAVVILIIAFSTGVIRLGSITNPVNTYSFTWKNYSFECISGMQFSSPDGDFSDGTFSTDNGESTASSRITSSGSVINQNNLQIAISANGENNPSSSSINCKITNLDLSNVEKVEILGNANYDFTSYGTQGDYGCSMTVWGLSSTIHDNTRTTFRFSDITAIKNSQGQWIMYDLLNNQGIAGNEMQFAISCNSWTRQGRGSGEIIISDIKLTKKPENIIIYQDCKNLGCTIGVCQSDGTCLDTQTNTTYEIINNTNYQVVNNTVYQTVTTCPFNLDKVPTIIKQPSSCQNGILYILVIFIIIIVVFALKKK